MGDLIDGRKIILELIKDNRSGKKLEIIVPTYNEEKRIGNILEYYGNDFDVVILDDGSNDKTVGLAIQSGATAFRRLGKSIAVEIYFVYYANEVSKSGYSFWFLASEYAKKEDLLTAYEKSKSGNCVIMARRIDWAYGVCARSSACIIPRGFKKGMAVYNPDEFHASLEYRHSFDEKKEDLIVDVHHLQIVSMKSYYGKIGSYYGEEIRQVLKSRFPLIEFIKRFLIREGKTLICELFLRFRWKGIPLGLWLILNKIVIFFVTVMCLIEKKCLKSEEEQLKIYKDNFKNK